MGAETGPSVRVFCPTRGYAWHRTAVALEPYHPTYVAGDYNVSWTRNRVVREFRASDDDTLTHPGRTMGTL